MGRGGPAILREPEPEPGGGVQPASSAGRARSAPTPRRWRTRGSRRSGGHAARLASRAHARRAERRASTSWWRSRPSSAPRTSSRCAPPRHASGRRLMVAENYCYKPIARVLRETIASGALGEVRFFNLIAVKSQRRAAGATTPRWRVAARSSRAGSTGSTCWPTSASRWSPARGFRPDLGTGLERSMLLVVEYRGAASGCWRTRGTSPRRFEGSASPGSTARRDRSRSSRTGSSSRRAVSGTRLTFPGLRDINGNRAMWTDFLDVIRTGREPVMTARRAQRGLELVEAAYRTAAETREGTR